MAAGLAPAVALGQAAPLQMPASFVAPNFDRVFVGLSEAHEAGAYLARTSGAAATWYNPAGFADLPATEVSLTVRGLNVGTLSLTGPLPNSTQITSFSVLPMFAAVAFGPEVTGWQDVRLALSATEQASWSALAWWGGTDASGHWTYVSDSSFSSYLAAASIAWSASPRLRLGGSLGGSWTQIYENDRLSALSSAAQTYGTIRTRLLNGIVLHLIPSLAAQFEPDAGIVVGAVVRAPGIKVWGRATLQGEQQDTTPSYTRDAFLQTGQADFDYRFPLELDSGIALRRETWELELDARYHASSGTYELVGTGAPIQTVAVPPGGAPVLSAFTSVQYQGQAVLDLAIGGSFALGAGWRLHAGAYDSPSPVGSGSVQFRRTDLYGGRAGVSFKGKVLSGSAGLGYETGRSSASPSLGGVADTPVDDPVRVRQVSLVFSLDWQ